MKRVCRLVALVLIGMALCAAPALAADPAPTTPGACFWGYVSPQNDTAHAVTAWRIEITQKDGNWTGAITSDAPRQTLCTPGLSGVFKVRVTASGPKMPETQLTPSAGSQADVGCNSNCQAMVGIVAQPGGTAANYWTVWDALCR
ncbi:MAG: hypothetical protein H0S85_04585 [Desulfovibrionaceae bacterium]|nr:hypothetical protein [Desulfovibrionaceae bacterium]